MANVLVVELDLDTGKFEKNLKGSTSTAKKAGGTMSRAFLGAGKAVGTFAIGVGVTSVKAFAEFEKELQNVNTLLGPKSEKTLENLKKKILALPPELGTATDLTRGLYQTISAGIEPTKAIEFLTASAKAAKAGLTDTFTAVDAMTSVLNSYGLEASKATNISNLMFETVKRGKTTFPELASAIGKVAASAASVGLPFDKVAAALATMTKSGLSTAEAVTSLRAILTAVKKGAGDLQLKEAGIEIKQLQEVGFEEWLKRVKVAGEGAEAGLTEFFTRVEATTGLEILTGNLEVAEADFAAMGEAAKDSATTTEEAFEKTSSTVIAQADEIRASMEKIGIAVGEKLMPRVRDALNFMQENMGSIQDTAELLASVIEKTADGIKFISQGLGAASVAAEQFIRPGGEAATAAALGGGGGTELGLTVVKNALRSLPGGAVLGGAGGPVTGGAGASGQQLALEAAKNTLKNLIPGAGLIFRQAGGPVAAGQTAVVGEGGPELFVPNVAGRVVANPFGPGGFGGAGVGAIGGGAAGGAGGVSAGGIGPFGGAELKEQGDKFRKFWKNIAAAGTKEGIITGGKKATGKPTGRGAGGLAGTIFQGTFKGAVAGILSGDVSKARDLFGKGFGDTLAQNAKRALVASLGKKLLGKLGGLLGIPGFQEGVASAPRGLAVVGEGGPELVNFEGGERVTSATDTAQALGGGGFTIGSLTLVVGGQAQESSGFSISMEEAAPILRGLINLFRNRGDPVDEFLGVLAPDLRVGIA